MAAAGAAARAAGVTVIVRLGLVRHCQWHWQSSGLAGAGGPGVGRGRRAPGDSEPEFAGEP